MRVSAATHGGQGADVRVAEAQVTALAKAKLDRALHGFDGRFFVQIVGVLVRCRPAVVDFLPSGSDEIRLRRVRFSKMGLSVG